MPRSCPGCGHASLPDESRFCLACGTPLGEAGGALPGGAYTPPHLVRDVLGSDGALEGERKDVTVLIADVAGSLAMADALDPEDVHVLMDGLFALALEVVHEEGGTINQFRGDGFMALFGAPRARGEDAARALRAALEIRQRTCDYGRSVRSRFGISLVVRMGVHSGLVWVGAIGKGLRLDYTAEGTTVGTAARLEEQAAPAQILVGEETIRRCRGQFSFSELGERNLRGLCAPVRVFELLDGEHTTRFEVEQGQGLSPLVGRRSELERLADAGRPRPGIRFVTVSGEAGIGKSRLVHEHLARTRPGTTLLRARCREAWQQRALLPWLELLRAWPAGLAAGHAIPALIARLEGRSGAAAGAAAELERSVRGLLEAAAEEGPVLLVLEDVQWADASTRSLLRLLAADPPRGRTVVLATRRDAENGEWGPSASSERIELRPLSPEESRDLARSILGEEPERELLADLAALRGGGNPLYVEELTRALCEGPEEVRKVARLEAVLRAAPVRVPETLVGVVESRIDALPSAAKQLLHTAAVFGEPFAEETLAAVEPGGYEQLASVVEAVLRIGLLERRGDLLDFHHQVVRDVAYAQILRERKAILHGRVAEVLAKGPDAETAHGQSRIGGHYDRAGRGEEAVEFLARAGRTYLLSLDAPQEAALHLRRAYELLRSRSVRDRERETVVGTSLASALNALDQPAEAAAVLESLDPPGEGSEAARLPAAVASVETGWVRFSEHNELARGRRLVRRGLELAQALPEGQRIALMALNYLSRMELSDGEAERAGEYAQRMVELGAAQGDRAFEVLGLHNRSMSLCDLGKLEDARSAACRALGLTNGADGDLLQGLAHLAMAKVHLFEGDVERTLAATERGSELGQRFGQLGMVYEATVWKGYAYCLAGEARAARDEFERLAQLNDRWPHTALHRARGQLEVGELELAASLAQRCLDQRPPRLVRLRALTVFGLAQGLLAKQSGEAEDILAESASLADALGLLPFRAEAREALAEIHARRGEVEQASYFARGAAGDYDACGMGRHAARARCLAPS